MWVAPNRRAIFCRSSCRDIATTRSAPIWAAASTAQSPTAPSPTTTTVSPGFTPAETAQCQPVGRTSERVSSDGSIDASGRPSVFIRLPSAWVTFAYSPCPPVVIPKFTQAEVTPATQCGQVLSLWQNGAITKSPARKDRTSEPTSSTIPIISWPMVAPGVMSFSPR